jgi:uncharacterized protein YPO0396
MEPITAAMAAFSALKAGVSAGKEIASMGKQVGKMFDAIDECRSDHTKKKSRQILSANEEALETFTNRKKAEDLEKQLREIVIATRGISAWQELIRLRGEIRRERAEEQKRKSVERQKLIENILIWSGVSIAVIVLLGGAVLIILAKQGRL